MPRYLAIDYLSQAIHERQNTLYRMLLAVPHHLECVDEYVHKGKTDDKLYNVPWQREPPDKILDRKPMEELSQITSCLTGLESFSTDSQKNLEDELIPSSNPDSPIINFDVWTDLEEEVMSYVVESFQKGNEVFSLDNSNNQDDNLIEEQETSDFMAEARDQIPKLIKLCSKLKPGVVQDPFTDSQGNQLSEHTAFKLDKIMNLSEEEVLRRNQVFRETFILQQIETNEGDKLDEPIMLSELSSYDGNIRQSDRDVNEKFYHEILSKLNKEDTNNANNHKDQDDDISEISCCKKARNVIEPLQFNNLVAEQLNHKLTDFVTINAEGFPDVESSLGQDDLFESPLPNVNDSMSTTPELHKTCTDLSPMGTSPAAETQVVTPTSKEKLVNMIWQNEKMFNDIWVKTLPVPIISGLTSNTTEPSPQKVLAITREEIISDLELQLPWDPLADVYCLAEIQNKISRVEMYHTGKENSRKARELLREIFEKVPWEGENISSPTDIIEQSATKTSNQNPGQDHRQEMTKKAMALDEHPKMSITTNKFIDDTEHASWNNCFSSLDDFIMLQKNKLTQYLEPPKAVVKAAKIRPSMMPSTDNQIPTTDRNKQVNIKYKTQSTKSDVSSNQKPEVMTKVVKVEISPEFQEVVEFMNMSIEPFLARLKESGVIHHERDLADLTPDYTRFAMKQVEVAMAKGQSKLDDQEMTYKLTICLHTLVGALDLLLNCGIDVALAHLSNSQEKYVDLLGNTLESIRRHLFNAHFKFQQNSIFHPKVIKVLDTIRYWASESKKITSTGKVLIITYRHIDYIYKELKEIISSFNGVRVCLLTSQSQNEFTSLMDDSDVVVASGNAIGAGFPWHLFSFVIEYEKKATSDIKPGSSELLKEFITLTMHHVTKQMEENTNSHTDGREETEIMPSSIVHSRDQYIVIGSTKIVTSVKLLHLLEARHNIMIYERDYSNIMKSANDSQTKMNIQPDLLIDERTCVVIEDLASLDKLEGYEKMKDMVLSLSLKCLKCYLILWCKSADTNMNAFKPEVSNHLSMLFASAAHFIQNKGAFQLEIMYTTSAEETAILVRRIGDVTRQASKVWDKQEWIKRSWLTDESSLHEKFLLSFPCMNSFSAQVMLTAASLSKLLTMNLEELVTCCPWIPESILNMFFCTARLSSSAMESVLDQPSSSPGLEVPAYDIASTMETEFDRVKSFDESWYSPESSTKNSPPVHHQQPFPAATCNNPNMFTPKSHASEDSLWLAIENEATNIEKLQLENDDGGIILHSRTGSNCLSPLKDLFSSQAGNNNVEDRRCKQGDFVKHNFNTSQCHPSHADSVDRKRRRSINGCRSFDCISFPTPSQRNEEADPRSINTNDQSSINRTPTLECSFGEETSKQHNVPMFHAIKNSDAGPSQRATFFVDDDDFHRYSVNLNLFSDKRDISHTSKSCTSTGNCVNPTQFIQYSTERRPWSLTDYLPGASLLTRRGSFESHNDPPSNRQQYQPSFAYGIQKQRERTSVNELFDDRQFNISTNVGIAQPLRRAEGSRVRNEKQETGQSAVKNKQVYNYAAPPLFETVKGAKRRKVFKEHEVPRLEPSPDDCLNDLSIFSAFAENQYTAKNQKLTYERVPGAKGGQTKLTFH